MDIIAAHQQGLIEQLEDEVIALAGRGQDHGQRAVVLHHLYDHSRGGHEWALAEARRALRIAAGLAALRRKLGHWAWRAASRDQAIGALNLLSDALGEAAQIRTASTYRAYRLSATKALRSEAERSLAPNLLVSLDQCHAARRSGDLLSPDARSMLWEECERQAEAATASVALDAAWAAVEFSRLRRPARALLGDPALARAAMRDERRGWARVEGQLRNDPALPAAFRANPAQHFYALQHMLQERRKQQWREACDRELGAFELAG